MFYILERVKHEEDVDKYLEHVLDYCNRDYQQTYKNQKGIELNMGEIEQKY